MYRRLVSLGYYTLDSDNNRNVVKIVGNKALVKTDHRRIIPLLTRKKNHHSQKYPKQGVRYFKLFSFLVIPTSLPTINNPFIREMIPVFRFLLISIQFFASASAILGSDKTQRNHSFNDSRFEPSWSVGKPL